MGTISSEEDNLYELINEDVADAIEHGIFVSNMAMYIAKEMKLMGAECHNLAIAGMLHDIGKLRLAGYLYGEESKSTVSRMKYARQHSTLSYEILKKMEYPDYILQAVLHHHENYDGTGYPNNLRGDEIPFGARVLRVCDVFVALISDRPYRKAFGVETAVELMIDEVKNYDMEIFLAFQRVIHNIDVYNDIKKVHINKDDIKCIVAY